MQTDDARDAARWRALLASGRLRLLGSAGFDNSSLYGIKDGRQADPSGYRHFGMEFWTIHFHDSSADNATGQAVLTAYADAMIEKGIGG